MRMIVTFEKGKVLRHIGHLDLMRTMQRALRRSGLPLQYSKGFNPHINLSFAAPLSVGVVGLRELMDVPLEQPVDAAVFTERMNATLPDCLRVCESRAVPDDFPTLMALVAGSRIRIELDAGVQAEQIAAALTDFMSRREYVALRRTKSGENMSNLRVFVKEASATQTPEGLTITCLIENNASGSLKPALLMKALCEIAGLEDVPFLAYREAILTRQKDGTLIPMEQYHG